MKQQLFLSLLITLSLPALSQPFNYMPASVEGHQVLTYTQFTLSYNEQHEQAEWVAYELTKAEAELVRDRCDCFKTDNDVSTGSATSSDYEHSGFDKGHLCPAADNNMSAQANRESFLFSNMSPQIPRFNGGIWKTLETYVGERAKEHDTLYVVTGPVFVNNLGTIGANEVTIPGYYYKTLLRFEGAKTYAIGFILPQIGAVGTLKDYAVPVSTIESLTGLDFYPELPDNEEEKIESQCYTTKWGL